MEERRRRGGRRTVGVVSRLDARVLPSRVFFGGRPLARGGGGVEEAELAEIGFDYGVFEFTGCAFGGGVGVGFGGSGGSGGERRLFKRCSGPGHGGWRGATERFCSLPQRRFSMGTRGQEDVRWAGPWTRPQGKKGKTAIGRDESRKRWTEKDRRIGRWFVGVWEVEQLQCSGERGEKRLLGGIGRPDQIRPD